MVEEVKQSLEQLSFTSEDTLVVAVSGGPDSMALLWVLLEYQKEIPYQLICAHVNHNVRKESVEEEKFVRDFCSLHNVIFECLSVKSWEEGNFHEQAHQKRYDFFERLIEKYHAKYLFTAHHGDDLIETILMHIVRGSTMKGYQGFQFKEKRENYTLVRPLLKYAKDELLDFVNQMNIPYVVDQSNEKDKYTRNRYRKYIIPLLKQEEPNLIKKFQTFSHTINLYEEMINEEVNQILPQVYQNKTLNLHLFENYSVLIQQKILYIILEKVYHNKLRLIHKRHISSIINLIHSKRPNAYIELPDGVIIQKNYDKLFFLHKNFTLNAYDIVLNETVCLPNKKEISFLDHPEDSSNFTCLLDSKEISLPLHVRSRKYGDKMEVKGLHGHKKIKDIFIDSKVDIQKRNEWPIVVDNKGYIVWLPGLKKSKFCKTKEEKYDIILKYH